MHIKRAKQEIRDSIEAYLKKTRTELPDPVDPAAADPSHGASGNREDPDHGTGRKRMWNRSGFLYDYTPHPAECGRTSVYPGGLWRKSVLSRSIR